VATSDPLGLGAPPVSADDTKPHYIGVQPWAAPTYPGATPFSPPSTVPPLSPSLASVAPAVDPALPPGSIGVLGPRYLEGDENVLRGLSTEQLARMQTRMVQAGLIDKKERYRLGLADDTTVKAYYSLLGFANRYGISDDEALTRLESVPLKDVTPPTPTTNTSTSTSTSVTPEATGRVTLRQAFEKELGRAPSDREYRAYQAALNAQEQASPASSVTTTTQGVDGNSTSNTVSTPSSAPSADVFADETVRSGKLGVERNTRHAVDYMDQALSVLGAGGQAVGFGA
jgi:hypothetical protein